MKNEKMENNFTKLVKLGKKLFPVAIRYIILLTVITAFFVGALFVAGLGGTSVQKRVQQNIRNSVEQLEQEGTYPILFNAKDVSNRLDNFTEAVILMQCLQMNTSSSPVSIFANRQYSDGSGKISSLKETARTGVYNDNYVRYWIGLRALVRPLLIFYTYPQIRSIAAYLLLGLWLISAVTIWKYTGPWLAAAFAISTLAMNMPIVSSCLQFIPCFLISFLAIILLPMMRKQHCLFTYPMFFFAVGTATQFLDFYTAPPITYCFPMIFLLSLENGYSISYRLKMTVKCLVGWGLGYVLMWIMKLSLSSLALETNAFRTAFRSFTKWTGISEASQYDRFTASKVFRDVFDLVFSKKNRLLLYGFLSAATIRTGMQYRKTRELKHPDVTFLLPGLLPILWILVAKRATGNHVWFQYRQMAGLVLSLTSFAASVVPFERGHYIASGESPDENNIESTDGIGILPAMRQVVKKRFSPEAKQARQLRKEELQVKEEKAKRIERLRQKADFYLNMGQGRKQTVESVQELLKIGLEVSMDLEKYNSEYASEVLQNAQRLVKQRMDEQQDQLEGLRESDEKAVILPHRGL